MSVTVEQVRAMPINELTAALEQKLQRPLPTVLRLQLAALHGAQAQGVAVYDPSAGGGHSTEYLDYEALVQLLNESEPEGA